MPRFASLALLLSLIGCSDGPTTFLVQVEPDPGAAVDTLDVEVRRLDTDADVTGSLPAAGGVPRLPGELVVRLPDVAADFEVTLRGRAGDGAALTVSRTVRSAPHEQVAVTMTLGPAPADGGADGGTDGGADASPSDAGGIDASDAATDGAAADLARTGGADLASGPDLAAGGCAVPDAGGRTVLLSDSFECDPVGTSPTGWKLEASGTFGVTSGSGPDTTHVLSHVAPIGSVSDKLSAGSAAWSDYTVEAQTVASDVAGTDCGALVMARWQDASNQYQFGIQHGNQYFFGKRQNGTFASLTQYTSGGRNGAFNYNVGELHTLALAVSGQVLTAFIDGAPVASGTDASFTVGAIGLGACDQGAFFDNVLVTVP